MDNEYNVPEIYHAEYGKFQDDFDIFCEHAGNGKSVLDLACGIGRLTVQLAQKGSNCVGIDLSPQMIDYAQKLNSNDLIRYECADICHYSTPKRYDLITLAGNAFQSLLTPEQQSQALERIRNHLKLDGYFVFDTRTLNSPEVVTKDWTYWHTFKTFENQEVKVYGKQDYSHKTQIVSYQTKRSLGDKENITKVQLRFSSFSEIKSVLESHGLMINHAFANYNRKPFRENDNTLIAICKNIK